MHGHRDERMERLLRIVPNFGKAIATLKHGCSWTNLNEKFVRGSCYSDNILTPAFEELLFSLTITVLFRIDHVRIAIDPR